MACLKFKEGACNAANRKLYSCLFNEEDFHFEFSFSHFSLFLTRL